MTTDTQTPDAPAIDEARAQAFGERVFGAYAEGMVTLMIDLGHRTGLLDTLAAGGGTSAELAERAGAVERYVREWLGVLVTAGIADYDPATRTYTLPAEHALCLSGPGPANLAPFSRLDTLLAGHVAGVARAVLDGGGVPYSAFRPEFTDVMDQVSRGLFDGQLVDGILPLAAGVPGRLSEGARVADVGCGTGHAVNLMARAFPRSTFVGYDLAEDAIVRARAEAARWGLTNVTFEVRDVVRLPSDPMFDVVTAFDAIHDQVDPARVLAGVHEALRPGGWFLMFDVRAASALEDNMGNPFAAWLYGISTLHCLTVSLAGGGAGLGTMWGEEVALRMLAEAGFVHLTVHEVPDDPTDSLYVARKAG